LRGGALLGGSWRLAQGPWSLGAELAVDLGTLKKSALLRTTVGVDPLIDSGSVTVKNKMTITPAFVVKYDATSTVTPFVSLGLCMSRLNIVLNDHHKQSASATAIGWAPTVGADVKISQKLKLRLALGGEYYRTVQKTMGDIDRNTNATAKVKLSNTKTTVALLYTF
jgi:opacity protein-like surface antigen